MKSRSFTLHLMRFLVPISLFWSGCTASKPSPKLTATLRTDIRGIYLSGYSVGNQKKWDETVDFIQKSGLNALVIDAKDDSGQISWTTGIPLAAEIGANSNKIKNIEARLQTLENKGIYSIARIVVFADPLLGRKKPEWSIHLKDGAQFRDGRRIAWPSPYRQEVWQYNLEIAARAARAGFQEIQFDYVRFPETRIDGVNWNTDLCPNDAINDFLRSAKKQLAPHGVWVSADVFGQTFGKAKTQNGCSLLGQDYRSIAAIVDTICPMTYPSHYAPGSFGVKNPNQDPGRIVRSALLEIRKLAPELESGQHRPWLQDFDLGKNYTARDVEAQIRGLHEAGINQWILWNARNQYTPQVDYQVKPNG